MAPGGECRTRARLGGGGWQRARSLLASDMLTLDADQVQCHVFTYKEGMLSALAHDLELRVTRLHLEISEHNAVSARFDATSLIVLHALKDGQPTQQLSAADRRKIEKTLTSDVLDVRRYPEIGFEASAAPSGEDFVLSGTLTLNGHARALTLRAHLRDGHMVTEATVHQPDYGIQPFSAMFGALKIRPDVQVRISLPWPLPV